MPEPACERNLKPTHKRGVKPGRVGAGWSWIEFSVRVKLMEENHDKWQQKHKDVMLRCRV